MQVVRIGKFRKAPYSEDVVCPRCNNNHLPIGYPGALSRVDNKTEICSPCGTDEGLNQYFSGILAPIKTWPIKNLPVSEEIHVQKGKI